MWSLLPVVAVVQVLVPGSLGTPVAKLANSSTTRPTTSNGTSNTWGSYRIQDFYQGQDFLKLWDFYSDSDPTHGAVNYQTRKEATSKGLAWVEGNVTMLAVDSKTYLQPGQNRDSIRIVSQKSYTGGLFIADFAAMPIGPSTWPAWWSTGPNWPAGGEIDVLEGVNDNPTNQHALHTTSGCTLDNSLSDKEYSGKTGNLNCMSTPSSNAGCTTMATDKETFGKGFNGAGGGVYAHLWNDDGIKIWHFSRHNITSDIEKQNPDPSSWGIPTAFYSSSSCDTSKHFYDHRLVINTALCGDWAGATFPGGQGACLRAVADPDNFSDAVWKINYIAVYNSTSTGSDDSDYNSSHGSDDDDDLDDSDSWDSSDDDDDDDRK